MSYCHKTHPDGGYFVYFYTLCNIPDCIYICPCPVLSGHCDLSVRNSRMWLQNIGRKVAVLQIEIRSKLSLLPVWSVLKAKSSCLKYLKLYRLLSKCVLLAAACIQSDLQYSTRITGTIPPGQPGVKCFGKGDNLAIAHGSDYQPCALTTAPHTVHKPSINRSLQSQPCGQQAGLNS